MTYGVQFAGDIQPDVIMTTVEWLAHLEAVRQIIINVFFWGVIIGFMIGIVFFWLGGWMHKRDQRKVFDELEGEENV
jgi:NhaP-type Na+/H+ or K+/H+ antiporter